MPLEKGEEPLLNSGELSFERDPAKDRFPYLNSTGSFLKIFSEVKSRPKFILSGRVATRNSVTGLENRVPKLS